MMRIFGKYLTNKKFILWFIAVIVVMLIIYRPLLSEKARYMDIKNISDYAYLFYVLVMPLTFSEMGLFGCLVLDMLFLCILSYMIISFVDFFFSTSSSTLTRIERKKWINKIIKINAIYSIFMTVFYIVFFIILCICNNLVYDLKMYHFIPVVYKLILTLIFPNMYLYLYFKSDNFSISVIISILIYVTLELLIKGSFNEFTSRFNYPILVICFLIVLYILIINKVKFEFKRRDV